MKRTGTPLKAQIKLKSHLDIAKGTGLKEKNRMKLENESWCEWVCRVPGEGCTVGTKRSKESLKVKSEKGGGKNLEDSEKAVRTEPLEA